MRPFFEDFYDSGFPQTWFAIAGNTLITAAAMVVFKEGSFVAGVIAFISYTCLAVQITHGTRKPYEYLKEIYVYPDEFSVRGYLFYGAFFSFRAHAMLAPILLVWWAYSSGQVPL